MRISTTYLFRLFNAFGIYNSMQRWVLNQSKEENSGSAYSAYSALPLFYSLFRFKNHLCIELYIPKAFKNRMIYVVYPQGLRRARFTKYSFSVANLHIVHLITNGIWPVEILNMYRFIHFVSFRFVSQNTLTCSFQYRFMHFVSVRLVYL